MVCLALVALLLFGVGFLLREQIGPIVGIRLANDCRRSAGRIGISMSVRNPSARRLPTCGPSQHAGT
jgi:hypothetical protein